MEERSFKHKLKTGIAYTAVAKYSGIVISLGVTAILSRLLDPADFGVIAIATVFIVFFSIFSDMGIGAAIIQKRDLDRIDISSLYSYTIFLGLVLAVAFFFSSWIIGAIYEDRQLIPICQLLSINILFATWNIVPNGLLLRDKQFKFIGIRTICVQLFLAIVSVFVAYQGGGVYTLLINPLGNSVLLFLFSYKKRPVSFTFRPTFNSVKKIASYSGFSFGFSLINYFTRNLDKLFIGKFFGMSQLGYYEKSYRLMLLPVQNLTHVITPVLHPILADYQNNILQQANKYFKLLKILALLGFPISCFLYFSAESMVVIIFGDQWMPSVPVFKILSLTIGLQITGSTIGAFLQATNMTKQMFWLGCINTLVSISGLSIGIFVLKNIEGVAWSWTVTTYLGLWNLWYIANALQLPLKKVFEPYLSAIKPTILLLLILLSVDYLCTLALFTKLIVNGLLTIGIISIYMKRYKIFDVYKYLEIKLLRFRS